MLLEFEAIGTRWRIETDSSADEHSSALASRIHDRIRLFNSTYSRFRDDSLVAEMATRSGAFTLPDDAILMWNLYRDLYRVTNGAFTPLIGSLLVDAGYDRDYSLTPKELRTPPAWDAVIEGEAPHITLKQPALFDFGSIGKGYLIDLVGEIIEDSGIQNYIINAGGDIRHRGEPIRIGLENPSNFEEAIGIATVASASFCGSSGSRRKWAGFHHIMDPRTLASPNHVLATWVSAPTTIVADAIATCLFLVPADTLKPHADFEYAILRPGNSIESSAGFQGEFFS